MDWEKVKFHSWISRWIAFFGGYSLKSQDTSLYRLATAYEMDRRRSVRVLFPPHLEVPGFQIFYEGHPLSILDMSLGGACLLDHQDSLQAIVGHTIHLEIKWSPSQITSQPALLVSSGYNKRHVRFENMDPDSFVKVNFLLKPGYLGTKMRKILNPDSNHVQLNAAELWVGLSGEFITLFSPTQNQNPLAEITFESKRVLVYPYTWPVYSDQNKEGLPGQRIKADLLLKLIFLTQNINDPSELMRSLQISLIEGYKELQKSA